MLTSGTVTLHETLWLREGVWHTGACMQMLKWTIPFHCQLVGQTKLCTCIENFLVYMSRIILFPNTDNLLQNKWNFYIPDLIPYISSFALDSADVQSEGFFQYSKSYMTPCTTAYSSLLSVIGTDCTVLTI